MSNQYFDSNRVPLGANMPPGGQIHFMANNPPVNIPNYPMPGQQFVQHVVVPVAVPLQPNEQFGQPVPFYSVTGIPDPSPEKVNKKSEDLNYYLGSETSRRSRRTRSRSHDRYSGDWGSTERPRSRNSDYDRRGSGSAARSDKDYDRASRSPEGSRHSRHSISYRKSETKYSDKDHDSPQDYSRENKKDYDSRGSRNEYRESRDSYRREGSEKYGEHEHTDRDSHRQTYEDDSDRYTGQPEYEEDKSCRSVDKYSDYDRKDEENRRKQWNDSKNVLQGKPRRHSYEREDYGDAKRRKYGTEYERNTGQSLGREGSSSFDKDYSVRERKRDNSTGYEREHYDREYQDKRQRDDDYGKHDEYDRNYERQTDYDQRQSGYDRQSREHVSDNPRKSNELKVHVDDRGRWIETNKYRSESVDSHVNRSSRGDQHDSGEGYKNDLNITIENQKAYFPDKNCDSKTGDETGTRDRESYGCDKQTRIEKGRDDRESSRYNRYSRSARNSANVRHDRPILRDDRYDDGPILRDDRYDDRPILRDDRDHDRPILRDDRDDDRPILRDDRDDDRPILRDDRDDDRPILRDDRYDVRRNHSRREDPRRKTNEYPGQSYNSSCKRSDLDNVSDSESDGHTSTRSNRSYRNPDRDLSPVSPPHHTPSAGDGSRNTRNPYPVTQVYDSDILFEVPILCLNHSSKTGCQDPKCPNWHVCRHFVKGRCEYGDTCKRGHNFFIGSVYKALFQHNEMKINFRQLNKKHIQYRIIGKLRTQLKDLFDKSEKVAKTEPGVNIDPEFDASNYDETGKFIKKSENEKAGESSTSDKAKETGQKGSGTDSKDKSDGTALDVKEEKKTTEKAIDSSQGSKANEKIQEIKESVSDVKKERENDQNTKGNVPDSKKEKENNQKENDIINKDKDAEDKKENKKDQCGSLSPVSVENIDNWEKYERYEKVSEDGLSDTDINKDDELENISSDEEVRKDEFPFNEHNILAKAAVPIGMNDPLVFNPSKNAPPNAHMTNRPIRMNEPLAFNPMRNAPPHIRTATRPFRMNDPRVFNPSMNFPPNAHMAIRPVRMNEPHAFNPMRNPPPPLPVASHPLFPAAKAIDGHMHNIGNQPRPHIQAPLPQPFTIPPPIPPVNYLPSPSLLQEVIQSLQSSQTKKSPSKAKVAKRKSGDDLESLVEKNPELNEVIQTPWQFPHKGMLNMSVIEFVTETEAYKEEFVAELMRILITLDLPYVTMKKLMIVIKDKMSINIKSPVDMRKILAMYPDCFQVIETLDSDDEDEDFASARKNVQIKARPSLGFCERHGYLPFAVGKCDCNALHICRFYFLSSCQKSKCKFGHKLKSNHNMTVFRSHKLHRLTGKEVMTFVRDVDNRNVEMVPEVCRFYNREKGTCYKGDIVDADTICHKLHLCQFYAKGNCYKNPCHKSHNIRDKQPLALLQMYGLDPNIADDDKILQMLSDVMLEMEKKKANRNAPHQANKRGSTDQTGNKASCEENEKVKDSDKQNKSDTSQNVDGKVKPKVRKVNVKLPQVCKFYNNELGCKKRDWGPSGFCMFIHVCQHFVTGDCKFGDKCKRSHDLVTGHAGQLLQKHGLDTSQYTSRELADVLNNPEEAMETAATNKSPVKQVVETVVVKSKGASVVETKVKVEASKTAVKESGAYRSYSVEDLLEQIIEKGKEEERKKAEQAENPS